MLSLYLLPLSQTHTNKGKYNFFFFLQLERKRKSRKECIADANKKPFRYTDVLDRSVVHSHRELAQIL